MNNELETARRLVPDWADADEAHVREQLVQIGLTYLQLKDVIDGARGYLRRDADRLARLEMALTLIAPDVRVAEADHG